MFSAVGIPCLQAGEDVKATAKLAIESHLDNPAIVLDSTAPAPLKSAALLLVGNLYENRTSLVEKLLHSNDTYDLLLNPYRVMCA